MSKKDSVDKKWQSFIDDFFASTSKEELIDIVKSVKKEHDEVDSYQPKYPDIVNFTIKKETKYNLSKITNTLLDQSISLAEAASKYGL